MTVPPALARRLVATLLGNLTRAYPSQINLALFDDGDARPPRQLTPIFYGCYDWHSAVHSHWALVRLRAAVDHATAAAIDRALEASLTEQGAIAELAFLSRRSGFERPYGLAWLLTLTAELRRAEKIVWLSHLRALEQLARDRLVAWTERLPAPIRGGEHSQSAFAMGLVLDWAAVAGDGEATAAVTDAARRFHLDDRDAPLAYEPSAYDFLSPALGVASLMARVLPVAELAPWLDRFAPALGRAPTLGPVVPADRGDGKLVHWDGLNLSRAWMLDTLAAALPPDDDRVVALTTLAQAHGAAGLASLDDPTYAGSHWLPSFAVYWLARVGSADARAGA